MQIVNGYACQNCSDVSLAKKGIDPAHPNGDPSKTGAAKTAQSANKLNQTNSADSASSDTPTSAAQTPAAVTFGGALTALNAAAGQNPGQPPAYQVGSVVSLSA